MVPHPYVNGQKLVETDLIGTLCGAAHTILHRCLDPARMSPDRSSTHPSRMTPRQTKTWSIGKFLRNTQRPLGRLPADRFWTWLISTIPATAPAVIARPQVRVAGPHPIAPEDDIANTAHDITAISDHALASPEPAIKTRHGLGTVPNHRPEARCERHPRRSW